MSFEVSSISVVSKSQFQVVTLHLSVVEIHVPGFIADIRVSYVHAGCTNHRVVGIGRWWQTSRTFVQWVVKRVIHTICICCKGSITRFLLPEQETNEGNDNDRNDNDDPHIGTGVSINKTR